MNIEPQFPYLNLRLDKHDILVHQSTMFVYMFVILAQSGDQEKAIKYAADFIRLVKEINIDLFGWPEKRPGPHREGYVIDMLINMQRIWKDVTGEELKINGEEWPDELAGN